MTAVASSNLAAVDHRGGTLTVEFHTGGVYEFFKVPHSIYWGLLQADSHGKYFHAHIKGRYSYRRIR